MVHAYAVTVYRPQGSEYPASSSRLPPAPQRLDDAAADLLYTAVTRTKQLVILVGLSTDPLRWVLSPLILSPAMKG